jgi:Tol biopolymer transport system component
MSPDGRFVAFDSEASNLVPGDTNTCSYWSASCADVFVHDRETEQTSLISVASDGTQGNAESIGPSISADGRYVAFESDASNLVPGDTNDCWYGNCSDIFVHDRVTGQTSRVSVASDGTQGEDGSYQPAISADGRYVAFLSYAYNLVPGDTNYVPDIFVHDRETGQTSLVSIASDGMQGNYYPNSPVISGDGRYVAFESNASNLVPGDTDLNCLLDTSCADVFVHDRVTGQTSAVSIPSGGSAPVGGRHPSISADGRYVAFDSVANDLVACGTNRYEDVFVHDRAAPVPEPPDLDINYQTGAPGSYFALSARNYPAGETASVRINGELLGTVPVDPTGSTRFLLHTAGAGEGQYVLAMRTALTVPSDPCAAFVGGTAFVLGIGEPVRPQDGEGLILDVPAGIAYTEHSYLSFLTR